MGAQEMLDKVQSLKEAILFEDTIATETEAVEFLVENLYQVLDILDDALYKYLNKEKE